MVSRTARERDRAMIRQLNEDQIAYVRERDARYAGGWNAYRNPGIDSRADQQQQDYGAARREYNAALDEWRRDVAACQAGYYERCAR